MELDLNYQNGSVTRAMYVWRTASRRWRDDARLDRCHEKCRTAACSLRNATRTKPAWRKERKKGKEELKEKERKKEKKEKRKKEKKRKKKRKEERKKEKKGRKRKKKKGRKKKRKKETEIRTDMSETKSKTRHGPPRPPKVGCRVSRSITLLSFVSSSFAW